MNLRPLMILPPLALGVAGFLWMTAPQEELHEPRPEARLPVRVMEIRSAPQVVTATGYGRVEAVHSWTAVSQVNGRITETVADLAEGTIVEQGTLLVQIDPTDYELAIRKSQANIAAAEASLAEIAAKEENSLRLMEIEQRILEVARKEFARIQDLFERGTATQSALDAAQKSLLAQETSMTNLQNTLALYPVQRASTEAVLAVRRAELAEARRALDNTTIRAPFTGQVTKAAAENGQFVRTGEQLVVLRNVDAVEIVASVQPRVLAPVLWTALDRSLAETAGIDPGQMVGYLTEAGVSATVLLHLAEVDIEYPAKIVRFTGSVDSGTGTIGIAVRVDSSSAHGGDTSRPPLGVGSFVSVAFSTPPAGPLIAVPRAAVQQDDAGNPFVYTVDGDDRLAISPVELGVVLGDEIVVSRGLADGDRLVLSSPRPPIEGLALTPVAETGGL